MTNATAVLTEKTAPTTAMPASNQQRLSTTISMVERQSLSPESICENRLQAALEHARRLTQMRGCQGANVAIAWEAVEELKTAWRKQQLPSLLSCTASFARYCMENPHALECLSYDC